MEKVKEEIENKKTSSKTKTGKTENNTSKQNKKTSTTNKKSSTTKVNTTKTNQKKTSSNAKTNQELNKANNVKKEKSIATENKNKGVTKTEVTKTKKTTEKAPKTEKKQKIEQNNVEDDEIKSIELVEEINIDEIKEKIENQNKIPEEKHATIKKNIVPNIGIALIVTIFHIFLELGFTNIEGSNYVIDLKVFSGIFLIIAIYLFEKAYNNEDSKLAVYGIESLVLSIFNFSLVYIYYAWIAKYQLVVFLFAILVCIYYSIKSIVIYIKKKKEYVIEKY